MEEVKHYSIIIQWSDEDEVYIATVPELLGCKTHGQTYEEALKQAQHAIEGWIEFAKELGRPIPAPNTNPPSVVEYRVKKVRMSGKEGNSEKNIRSTTFISRRSESSDEE